MAAAYPRTLPYDPAFDALDRAPMGEPLAPELEAEIARAEADIRSGRVELIPHAEVGRAIEEMRRQQGG